MVLVIHIKVEETSKVFKGFTISNWRYDFRVDQKLNNNNNNYNNTNNNNK